MTRAPLFRVKLCPECLCRWLGPLSHHEDCSLYGVGPNEVGA